MKMNGFMSALAWSALVLAGLLILSVLTSGGIATWEWAQGNTTPKAGWEGFPIMLMLLTMASGLASVVVLVITTVYSLVKGPIRLPFPEKHKQGASNTASHGTAYRRP